MQRALYESLLKQPWSENCPEIDTSMINRNLHLELAFCECESSDTVVLQVLQVKPEYGCSHQCNAGDTTSHKFDSVEVRVKWRYALKIY